MKTIGQILKNARVSKDFSLRHVEKMTKIKSIFIGLIEEEKWDSLPAFPTVLGFVKSLAGYLEIDPNMAVAVLKRDYPPKKLKITPKPDIDKSFFWSPKLTFILGISGVLIALLAYLLIQYVHFVSSPTLKVDSPKENQIVSGNNVVVFGSTDNDAKLTVNGQPVMLSDDGKFSISLDIAKDTKEITITASSRSGKITTVRRTIVVQPN